MYEVKVKKKLYILKAIENMLIINEIPSQKCFQLVICTII